MALSCCTHISRIRKKNKTLYGFKVDLIDGQRSVWGVPRALAPARFLLALRQPPPPLHDRSIGYFVYKRSIYPSVRARWLYKVCQTVWCRPAEDDLLTDELAHLHMVNDRFKVRPLKHFFFLCGLDALLDFSINNPTFKSASTQVLPSPVSPGGQLLDEIYKKDVHPFLY